MKEVKISGINKGDKVFKAKGGLVKIRLSSIGRNSDLQDSAVVGVVKISGAIVGPDGKALRRAGITDDMVAASDNPAALHLVNKPVMVTIQKSDNPDFDPRGAIEAAIRAHIEDTLRMENQVKRVENYLKNWL